MTINRGPVPSRFELGDLEQVYRIVDDPSHAADTFRSRMIPSSGTLTSTRAQRSKSALLCCLSRSADILRLNLLRLITDRLNVFLGNAPRPQRVDGAVDCADVFPETFLIVLPESRPMGTDIRFGHGGIPEFDCRACTAQVASMRSFFLLPTSTL